MCRTSFRLIEEKCETDDDEQGSQIHPRNPARPTTGKYHRFDADLFCSLGQYRALCKALASDSPTLSCHARHHPGAIVYVPLRVQSSSVDKHSPASNEAAQLDPRCLGGDTSGLIISTIFQFRVSAKGHMTVSGSQQVLDISARVLLDPGNRIWIEDPATAWHATYWLRQGANWCPFR
jgi:hypothetical protein